MNDRLETDRIFLDVDGVLADWVRGVCELFDEDYDTLLDGWGDEWDIRHELDITTADMWARIDEVGADFWAELQPYPWGMDLYEACADVAPVTLLTSPSLDPSCAAGKVTWIQRHFGRDFRDFLIGPDKEACARPGAVLIDDKGDNVNAFVEGGGRAWLFPRPWNLNRNVVGREMHWANNFLSRL